MIKVLALGFGLQPADESDFRVSHKNLHSSNCFGNDFIIADVGESPQNIYGVTDMVSVTKLKNRWVVELKKWLKEGKTIIVIVRPHASFHHAGNYGWLPINLNWTQIYDVGQSDYAGKIVTTNPSIKEFFERQNYHIRAHIREPLGSTFNPIIEVSDKVYSSVEVEVESGKILLVPPLQDSSDYFQLIKSLYSRSEDSWNVEQLLSATESLSKAIEIEEKAKKNTLFEEKGVSVIALKLKEVIDTDLFASKSISIYRKVEASNSPDPRDFYDIIETLEKSFDSQREMREKLGISKNSVSKVMRRANHFRHANKEGIDPTPLTDEEIKKFKKATKSIIDVYVQYLFDKL